MSRRPAVSRPPVDHLPEHAALVGADVWDWTMRQFDPQADVPTVTPWVEWRSLFRKWRSLFRKARLRDWSKP